MINFSSESLHNQKYSLPLHRIENKTIAKHVGNDWRDGRVVDCGGLENR